MMTEFYLERQAAIFSALTDKSLKKKISDILVTLSDNVVKVAEEVTKVLKPLKLLCSYNTTEH